MNLNKYSLTNKNIIQSVCITEENKGKKQNSIEVKITKKKTDYFYPSLDCKDSLFWCWISHHYGFQEYELNKNDLYNYEINKKFEYVSYIRGNKLLLKSLKLNRTKLEESLLDDNGINLGLFTFIKKHTNVSLIDLQNGLGRFHQQIFYLLLKFLLE